MQYTVKEFRQSMRKALNEIDAGGRVTIERYGKIYQVLPTDLREIEISGIKVVKLETPPTVIKTPTQAKEVVEKIAPVANRKVKLCKHGNPLDNCFDKKADRSCRS